MRLFEKQHFGRCLLCCLLSLAFLQAKSELAQASDLPSLNKLAVSCFRSNESESCLKGLLMSESLQKKAEKRKRFPCQTRLLGLGSDLILSQMQKGDVETGMKMLGEVNENCVGF